MTQLRQMRQYFQLLLFMPFLLVALVPQGMMLSKSLGNFEDILVICSPDGVYRISASELPSDIARIPDMQSGDQVQHSTDIQDSSCPYSIVNNGFLDTATRLTITSVSHVQPKPLALYRSQYTLRAHPASYPRGPPLSV